MDPERRGEIYALLAALTWAVALLLYRKSTDRVSPVAMNLFKNAVGLVLLAATIGVLAAAHGLGFGRDEAAVLRTVSLRDMGWLLLSGVIGISVADTLFLRGLQLTGVGLVSIADCCYCPSALLFSWAMLGERITPVQGAGALLIIGGVLVAARHDPPHGRTRAEIAFGMMLAAFSVALMALGIVMATPMIRVLSPAWVAGLRLAAGTLVLAGFASVGADRREVWAVFRPAAWWKAALPGSVLGMYVCLLLWVAGFKYAHVPIVAILNQTSVIFAILLASVFLRESFTRRKLAAVTLALAGVAVVTCAGWLERGLGLAQAPAPG